MKTVGIITEFNPFHNGHAYLFNQIRKQGADIIICVMSGPFTQRGEAALCSKWVRARMAVQCGADLVAELPVAYAVRSAYDFARGGIYLLQALGAQHLAFGCETPDLSLLKQLAQILAEEPPIYRQRLQQNLRSGKGFAAARTAALQECLSSKSEAIVALLHAPNTILALEYLHVLTAESIPLKPWLIPRQGAGYHDTNLQHFASAQAIRSHLYAQPQALSPLKTAMPEAAYLLLQEEITQGRAPFQITSWDVMLLSRLRMTSVQELALIFEMREGLENRILKTAYACGTVEQLVQAVSGRRYPRSRIRRLLLYAWLGLTQQQAAAFQQDFPLRYAHILAANINGQRWMQKLHTQSPEFSLLSSGRELRNFLHQPHSELQTAQELLQFNLKATSLYHLGMPNPSARVGDSDFRQCGIMDQ